MRVKFQIDKQQFLSGKSYDGVNFTPTPSQRLLGLGIGQNTSVGIGLIELAELSDALNYKPFFRDCILSYIFYK